MTAVFGAALNPSLNELLLIYQRNSIYMIRFALLKLRNRRIQSRILCFCLSECDRYYMKYTPEWSEDGLRLALRLLS